MPKFVEHALSESVDRMEVLLRDLAQSRTMDGRDLLELDETKDFQSTIETLALDPDFRLLLQVGHYAIQAFDTIGALAMKISNEEVTMLKSGSSLELSTFRPSISNHVITPPEIVPRPYVGEKGKLIPISTLAQTLADHGQMGIVHRTRLDDSSKSV